MESMTPEQLRDAIVKALDRLTTAADPDSVATLEKIFNLLEDDQRV